MAMAINLIDTIKNLITRKAFLLLAVSAIAITPALAEVVTYNTTGVFSMTGTNVLTGPHGLSITYENSANMVTNPFPTNAGFGAMMVVGPTMGSDTVSSMFSLTITQTGPTAGTETLTDMISGTIEESSSAEILKFVGAFLAVNHKDVGHIHRHSLPKSVPKMCIFLWGRLVNYMIPNQINWRRERESNSRGWPIFAGG
jgi:hypothetical protein